MINIFIIIKLLFLILIQHIHLINSKCIMYDVCSNKTHLVSSNPSEVKWYTCKKDYVDAIELYERHEIDLFKYVCPMLFNNEEHIQHTCCSYNQLIILKNDLQAASSVIGSCPSCYHNFRSLWCHMACDPNQSDFLVPVATQKMKYYDFQRMYDDYLHEKEREEEDDKDGIDEEVDEEHHVAKRALEINDDNREEMVITKVDYYLNDDFITNLIDSCADVKLYTSDSLQTLCGAAKEECTNKQFTQYLGLLVEHRPFDINITLTQNTSQIRLANNQLIIKPINPKTFKCNESYEYDNVEYGAKCSCKDCRASCSIDNGIFITQSANTNRMFTIGDHNGLSIIMLCIFLTSSTAFVVITIYFRYTKRRSTTHTKLISNGHVLKKNPHETCGHGDDEHSLNQAICCLDKLDMAGELFEQMIVRRFSEIGRFCASYPKLVLTLGLAFVFLMCLGFIHFKIENDPINLWSSETSIARQNKKYFDEHFAPFYRITQMIVVPKSNTTSALDSQVLLETYKLYSELTKINAHCATCRNGRGERVRLSDICYKPMQPENKQCAIQTIYQYWSDHEEMIELFRANASYENHLLGCMKNPFNQECLSSYGEPIQPFMIVGGYNDSDYQQAQALVTTFVINNQKTNQEFMQKALVWELQALQVLKNYTSDLIHVYYTTERSIEDEIERESKADMKIIVISYLAMFLYLTLTLGKYSSMKIKMLLLETKMFLGLAGVLLVLLSVFASGGLWTYFGVPASLITLEVIPFLLLAVGVDNIYVIVQTYQNDDRIASETVEDQIARVVGKVGPSMLLTGVTQSVSFLISALTPMPGVRAFSLYASSAIILNFLLQITCFVVLLTLDAKREKSKRSDILCFYKLSINELDEEFYQDKKSMLFRFFKKVYKPFLFNKYVRPTIIIAFFGFFCLCITMCAKIRIGLDQRLAMPVDSYQIKYFDALEKYLKVGPPVYFVVKDGFDYTSVDELRKLCGSSACKSDSLQSTLSQASFFSNVTYIAQSSVNWIDDYIEWLTTESELSKCCYVRRNDSTHFCDVDMSGRACKKCEVELSTYSMPSNETFLRNIQFFLKQNPSEQCVKAGHAMYGNAVNLIMDEDARLQRIGASHFMGFHSVLSTSEDFINAMNAAHNIAKSIETSLNKDRAQHEQKVEVFPYSVFYVFYEQYLNIWKDATMQLIVTLCAVFLCTFIFLSFDIITALIITGVISMMIIDMVGIMYLWNIELNAVSLVNLVIAIGISVEFCAHIARAFATSSLNTRVERAAEALYTMGPPVFSGILQSIVGISVLAFANSQLFQVFYFRMYFSILMLGITHGLVFLPVLLTYIGRRSNHKNYLKLSLNNNPNNLNNNKSSPTNSQELQLFENKRSEQNFEFSNLNGRLVDNTIISLNGSQEMVTPFQTLKLADPSKELLLSKEKITISSSHKSNTSGNNKTSIKSLFTGHSLQHTNGSIQRSASYNHQEDEVHFNDYLIHESDLDDNDDAVDEVLSQSLTNNFFSKQNMNRIQAKSKSSRKRQTSASSSSYTNKAINSNDLTHM